MLPLHGEQLVDPVQPAEPDRGRGALPDRGDRLGPALRGRTLRQARHRAAGRPGRGSRTADHVRYARPGDDRDPARSRPRGRGDRAVVHVLLHRQRVRPARVGTGLRRLPPGHAEPRRTPGGERDHRPDPGDRGGPLRRRGLRDGSDPRHRRAARAGRRGGQRPRPGRHLPRPAPRRPRRAGRTELPRDQERAVRRGRRPGTQRIELPATGRVGVGEGHEPARVLPRHGRQVPLGRPRIQLPALGPARRLPDRAARTLRGLPAAPARGVERIPHPPGRLGRRAGHRPTHTAAPPRAPGAPVLPAHAGAGRAAGPAGAPARARRPRHVPLPTPAPGPGRAAVRPGRPRRLPGHRTGRRPAHPAPAVRRHDAGWRGAGRHRGPGVPGPGRGRGRKGHRAGAQPRVTASAPASTRSRMTYVGRPVPLAYNRPTYAPTTPSPSICTAARTASIPAIVVNPGTVVTPAKYSHSTRTNSASPPAPTRKPRYVTSRNGAVEYPAITLTAYRVSVRSVYPDRPWSRRSIRTVTAPTRLVPHSRHTSTDTCGPATRSKLVRRSVRKARKALMARPSGPPNRPARPALTSLEARLRANPCSSSRATPYTRSTSSVRADSSAGTSSGGCCRSSSIVTTTSCRAARTPASSALCCP